MKEGFRKKCQQDNDIYVKDYNLTMWIELLSSSALYYHIHLILNKHDKGNQPLTNSL